MDSSGRLLDAQQSLEDSFDCFDPSPVLTAVVLMPKVVSTDTAFALWCPGSPGVATWGHRGFGGDSSSVQDRLHCIWAENTPPSAPFRSTVDGLRDLDGETDEGPWMEGSDPFPQTGCFWVLSDFSMFFSHN